MRMDIAYDHHYSVQRLSSLTLNYLSGRAAYYWFKLYVTVFRINKIPLGPFESEMVKASCWEEKQAIPCYCEN